MRAALALALLVTGCAAARVPVPVVEAPPASYPAPVLYINPGLADAAQICLPRETFRAVGLVCIYVGELREMLRGRRTVAWEVR